MPTLNVHVMVIESPFASVTALNMFLASIPEPATVVLLNRPDSVTAPIAPPADVNVLDITICGIPAVKFPHVLVVATPLSPPYCVLSVTNFISVSAGPPPPVPMAITSQAPVRSPVHTPELV